ncbi:hypothetical protein B10525_17330 (plasmid) [Campylobacter jejuni]|nr:hypothetical protein B10525_17330 [Campylobacter jejuni]
MSNKIENYPNIEKLQTILNELAFHQIHQAWIDKKNSTIQLDNTREMGRVLSEHNQESRNVRSNDTSIATNTNGISNLGEQRSRQEERTGANRYGDTSRRANKSQSIHSDRTPNLFSFISRNDDERQGTDAARSYNQQSVLETAARNDGYERRSLKSGQKLDFVSDDEIYLGSLKDRFQKTFKPLNFQKLLNKKIATLPNKNKKF